MKKTGLILLFAVACLGAGCAARNNAATGGDDVLTEARGPDENRKLHTDLIREMIDDGRLYAAMAHLEAQEKQFGVSPQSRLLRAEVLRKLGRGVEAEKLYQELLDAGQFRGYAQHGLGLIYAPQNLGLAITHLQRAAALLPTDARVRNDLGFALLKVGQIDDADLNLATAYQLDSGGSLARNNYIVCLLVQGNERQARRIAADGGVDQATMKHLRERAQHLKLSAGRTATGATAQAGGASSVGSGGG